jgi:hypothetical protein
MTLWYRIGLCTFLTKKEGLHQPFPRIL